MTSKSLGPTANLIRQSRLMAMPPPLSHTLSDTQFYRLPHPTHQAITTPESSRRRGDWGLKRPIPRKVESTYIRYNNIDTMEHMTKIESSHDTVLTLKKWQEMDIPVGISDAKANRFTSSFYFDITASSSSRNGNSPQTFSANVSEPVWGYREKSVQAMTPGELKTFVSEKLVPRRREFEDFAEKWFDRLPKPPPAPQFSSAATDTDTAADQQDQSLSLNTQPEEIATSDSSLQRRSLPNFSVTPLSERLKSLRSDPIQSYNVIHNFLQIPLKQIPMRVHPSGGLYYTLDSSYLENHPERGPNQDREVPARLLYKIDGKDLHSSRKRMYYVIGGIVQFAQHEMTTAVAKDNIYSVSRVINVVPMSAALDQRGKILIELDRIAPTQFLRELVVDTMERHSVRMRTFEETKKAHEGSKTLTSRSTSPSTPSLTDSRGKFPNAQDLDRRLVNLISFLSGDQGKGSS
ncbi:hypothetical protein TWF694_002783 [Orbilia ellipsospora]|uniref:Uncharacterized protein n=1 Tax=Orbilia ellipsospora TaxID=2528407 RepID=A0AAV9WZM1_9PEZI